MKIYLDGAGDAGRRSAVRPTTSTASTAPFDYPCSRTTWPIRAAAGQNLYSPDPLPEVVQDRGRQGLGQLLPVHLHDLSPRERRCPRSAPPLAAENAAALASGRTTSSAIDWEPIRPRLARAKRPFRDTVRVAAGETASVLELTGPRAITAIRVKLDLRATARTRWPPCAEAGAADHLGRPDEAGRLVPAGRLLRHGPRRESLQVARDRHDRRTAATPTGTCRLPRTPWSNWSTKTVATARSTFEIVHAPLGAAVRGPGPLPRQVAPRRVPAAQGPLARLGHAADRKAAGGSAA